MNRWPVRTIDEIKAKRPSAIAIGPFGSRMKSECYVPSGVPVIRGNNISDTRDLIGEMVYITPEKAAELKSSVIYPGDLFFPHRGAIGLVGIVPEEKEERYMLSSSLMKLSCNKSEVEPLFLLYFFRSEQGRQELLKNASTVGTPGIGQPLATLKSIPVPLPSLPEQKAIAHILGTLDDKIELNRRSNQTLEAMARALFQSWFVDFDPVRAKLDGRKPVGMDAATASLFPAYFQYSSIGLVPQGWEVKPMSEMVEVGPARLLKSGVVAPYLDMKNMPTQGHAVDDVVDRRFTSGTKFKNNDTLLARITPCLENGKTAFVDFLENGEVAWGSTEYIVLAPRLPLTPEFGYYLARSDALRIHAIQSMTGTSGRQRVASGCFSQFFLAVPPAKIAQHFGSITQTWMKQIHSDIEQSRTLATLRDTLLPKLLTGELDVR